MLVLGDDADMQGVSGDRVQITDPSPGGGSKKSRTTPWKVLRHDEIYDRLQGAAHAHALVRRASGEPYAGGAVAVCMAG